MARKRERSSPFSRPKFVKIAQVLFFSGLKLVKIIKNRVISSCLSVLKSVSMSKKREICSFLSALKFVKIEKN